MPKFHSIKFVAERLDLSLRSVQRLIERGVLASCKFGAAVRISDDDLQQFLARSRQSTERD